MLKDKLFRSDGVEEELEERQRLMSKFSGCPGRHEVQSSDAGTGFRWTDFLRCGKAVRIWAQM